MHQEQSWGMHDDDSLELAMPIACLLTDTRDAGSSPYSWPDIVFYNDIP